MTHYLTFEMENISEVNISGNFSSEKKVEKFTAFYIIITIEAMTGLLGNSLFLISFIKARNTKPNMYIIMQSLAVVDILLSLSIGSHFVRDLLIPDYKTQNELCRFLVFFGSIGLVCNSLHLLLMAVDRLVAIYLPHRLDCTGDNNCYSLGLGMGKGG